MKPAPPSVSLPELVAAARAVHPKARIRETDFGDPSWSRAYRVEAYYRRHVLASATVPEPWRTGARDVARNALLESLRGLVRPPCPPRPSDEPLPLPR